MERKHADRLHERFPCVLAGKRPIVLRIPDDHGFNDPEPVALHRTELSAHLEIRTVRKTSRRRPGSSRRYVATSVDFRLSRGGRIG
jgi:hypothetical protein